MSRESSEMRGFRFTKSSNTTFARLGQYRVPNRANLDTPAMILTTSRGMVPHLTPDHVSFLSQQDHSIAVNYAAEDFMDKLPDTKSVPFLMYGQMGGGQKSKDLVSVPDTMPVITTVRKPAPIASPKSNSNKSISIMTSEGFRYLDLAVYHEFFGKFGSDIVISPADVPNLSPGHKPGRNRVKNMMQRTEQWLEQLMEFKESHSIDCDVFGSILPNISLDVQLPYLETIIAHQDELTGVVYQSNEDDSTNSGRLPSKLLRQLSPDEDMSGSFELALTSHKDIDLSHLAQFRSYIDEETGHKLANIYSAATTTPQEALELVAEGMDLLFIGFVNSFSDAGVALDFSFGNIPAHESTGIGYNLWEPKFTTDMSALSEHEVTCYGQKYHKAYIHHLLRSHEMSAWVILQLHNYEICETFFKDVRQSINDDTFAQKKEAFTAVYGSHLDALALRDRYVSKSTLPKLRGHQVGLEQEKKIRLQGTTARFNDPAYRKL